MEVKNLAEEVKKLKENLHQESVKFSEAIDAKNKEQIDILGERINKMLEEIKVKSFVLNDLANN